MASTTRTTSTALLLAAVGLVAANMRPTITAVGPLLDQIGDDTGLATAALGLLAAVPLLTWAVVSPLVHDLGRRFGVTRVVLWSLLLLAAGTVVRSLPGPTASLWIGTALIGVALSVTNVLMPAVVKRDHARRVAMVMAIYTALLGGMGALASGVAVPLSLVPLGDEPAGWRFALLVIGGVLLPPAIAVWAWAHRGSHEERSAVPPRPRGGTGIWRDAVAWQVAAYMGLQSAVFYMTVTWLAAISTSTGRSPVVAGIDVMVYQIFALVGALLVPLTLRGGRERYAPALVPSLAVVGVIGLIAAPGSILVWAPLIGLSSGASLGMSLTLMAIRARTHQGASALSGMSQSVGYAVAALGPVAFGALHAATGGWLWSLALLLAVLLAQAAVGVFAGRDRYVLDRP
ncbi:MFS transporter [Microbacterium deminutum]|uniref:MFS transporter n=1 Tax=Microbacterium deminutum TaxID=344164 RepID=A0ABP5CYZ6_9MICO